MSGSGRPVRPSLADTLQSVLWEYNEDEHSLSPLVATIRYFERFPWEGPDEGSGDGGEPLSPEPAEGRTVPRSG